MFYRFLRFCLPLLVLISSVQKLHPKTPTDYVEQMVNDEQSKKFSFIADKLGLLEGEQNLFGQMSSKLKKIIKSPATILVSSALIGATVKVLVDTYLVQSKRIDNIEASIKKNSSYITWLLGIIPGGKIAQNLTTSSYTWLKGDGGQSCYIDELCGLLTGVVTFYILWKATHNEKIRQNADRRAALLDFVAHWPEYEIQTPDALKGFFRLLYARYAANEGCLEFDDKLLDALYNLIIFEQVEQLKPSVAH